MGDLWCAGRRHYLVCLVGLSEVLSMIRMERVDNARMPCVERDPTIAYDEAASSHARLFIQDFLVEIFRSREYLEKGHSVMSALRRYSAISARSRAIIPAMICIDAPMAQARRIETAPRE